MKSLAVFCGSKAGNNDLYTLHAQLLGKSIAENGFGMVYGGGKTGLMGTVAAAALSAGGSVIGIIPEQLRSWEHQHNELTELVVVPDMHTRKKMMYNRCDAAIILPGGFGTMDELFEMLTWNQLAIHEKHIFILNTAGYYTDLYQMMQVMHLTGFLYEPVNKRVGIYDLPENLMKAVISTKMQSQH